MSMWLLSPVGSAGGELWRTVSYSGVHRREQWQCLSPSTHDTGVGHTYDTLSTHDTGVGHTYDTLSTRDTGVGYTYM